jgi:predicted ATPase
MKLLELTIEGYRSIRSQVWRPGDLNVIIGPNASGKSNLIRAIELLSIAARGSLGKYIQQEGGIGSLLWDGQTDCIRLQAKFSPISPDSDRERDSLTYRATLAQLGRSNAYRIDDEALANECLPNEGIYKLLARDTQQAIVFDMKRQHFEAPPNAVPEQETLLSAAAGPFAANPVVAQFQQKLSDWKVYQTFQTHRDAPIRAPQVTRADTQVNADGQNLVNVLHTLYTSSREFKTEVNTAMQAAFGDDFEELVFPPAADQRIQLRIRWRNLQREQSAADLSDGTLRFLFLLAVLANPAPAPLIAIDEPETGLHPSMLPIVAEFARDAAARSQVLLTTHSPEFLDAFGTEVPTTTIVERKNGETQLNVLSGDELTYWLEQYTLGQLYRSKELEAMR